MLEKAEGQKCHATNFLKAFSGLSEGMIADSTTSTKGLISQASKLQLTEETSPQSTLEIRIQAANRFLLRQVSLDFQRIAPTDAKVDQVFDDHHRR